MNTCKDCIHYDICQYHITEETTMTVNECSHGFKHKDQYVFMPAYVGQKVWHVRSMYKYEDNKFKVVGYEVEEGKVSMLQQKADKSWKIRITIRSSVGDYTLDEFSQYICLTEDAAKAKLERLEKELTNEN